MSSKIVERFKFHCRLGNEDESVAMFVAGLRNLSEHCNFGESLEDKHRDRLVCGINNQQIQKRLLVEPNLKYQKAVELALAKESASRSVGDLHTTKTNANSARSTENINKVMHGRQSSSSKSKQEYCRCGGDTNIGSANLRKQSATVAKRKDTLQRNVEIARKIKIRNHLERTKKRHGSR